MSGSAICNFNSGNICICMCVFVSLCVQPICLDLLDYNFNIYFQISKFFGTVGPLNSLPNDEFLDCSKPKAFAEHKINVT